VLKFLSDESCDFAIVSKLRDAGFDVKAIVEDAPGAIDSKVLEIASKANRILLTEDKDFGEWVFAHKHATPGVVLIRYPARMRPEMIQMTLELLMHHGNELSGKFTVLEPGRARVRNLKVE